MGCMGEHEADMAVTDPPVLRAGQPSRQGWSEPIRIKDPRSLPQRLSQCVPVNLPSPPRRAAQGLAWPHLEPVDVRQVC